VRVLISRTRIASAPSTKPDSATPRFSRVSDAERREDLAVATRSMSPFASAQLERGLSRSPAAPTGFTSRCCQAGSLRRRSGSSRRSVAAEHAAVRSGGRAPGPGRVLPYITASGEVGHLHGRELRHVGWLRPSRGTPGHRIARLAGSRGMSRSEILNCRPMRRLRISQAAVGLFRSPMPWSP
jgi:hypothetical protein